MKNKKPPSETIHPKDKASFFSHFLFCWQIPIIVKEKRHKISENDFVIPVENQESRIVGNQFETLWNEQLLQKKPSLIKVLLKATGFNFFFFGAIIFLVDVIATILQPLYLGKLLSYFIPEQISVTKNEAYLCGLIIVLSSTVRVLFLQFFFLEMTAVALKVRVAFSSLIYRKILNSPKTTIQNVTLGQIVNLLSNDVDKFDRVFSQLHFMWIGPVKMVITGAFLYILFGVEGVMGTATLLVFLLFQCWFFKIIATARKKVAVKTDYRIRIMNDIITGIRIIKMYAWEEPFAKLVYTARKLELDEIVKSNHIQTVNFILSTYIHKIPIYVCILVVVLSGTPLTPQFVFISTNIYDLLKQTLLYSISGVNQMSEAKTTIDRVQNFLLLNSETKNVKIQMKPKMIPTGGIFCRNVCANWDLSSAKSILRNINFEIFPGELLAIIGAAGSGKSTLLQLLLNEVSTTAGKYDIEGSISYASQEPWIFPGTIKQNIIFGEEYNEDKYGKIVRVCALEHDISMFAFGDNTLVGERGVTLSGGQKARINLARAIYKDADIYLLDDPLSAVDAVVAYQIFVECFLKYLKNKTVVLVTHQLQFLQSTDKICILGEGEVKHFGKYKDLQSVIGTSFEKFEKKHLEVIESKLVEKYESQSEVKESSSRSNIGTYKTYFSATGHWIFTCIQFVLLILSQFFMNISDGFVSFWVNIKQDHNPQTNWQFFTDLNCLYIYTALLCFVIFFFHISAFSFINFSKRASRSLHDTFFHKIMQGSMTFFNCHSSGRILNRFSRDVGIIDEFIPRSLPQMIRMGSIVVGVCIVVVVLNYWIVIPTIVLLVLFYLYLFAFQPALNRFKATAAVRKSPAFTHVSATVQGLTTIRASKAQDRLLSQFDDYQNSYSAVEYIQKALYFAFSFWTDFTSNLYTAVIIFYLLTFAEDSLVGNIGLSITQSLLLIGSAQYTMKLYGETDSQMTSVKRIVEYTDLLPEDESSSLVPEIWPKNGQIVFDSVSLRYSIDKPYVLKKINLEIQPGEKIGIIGRTGAGKSSLISVLFRLHDFEGTIFIDNVNTKSIPLKTLRSNIAIIPQDPILFLGTIRSNLDPFNEFSDHQLWSALGEIKIEKLITGLPSGLDSVVLEAGANFSVGQRQMLCLVRALLKNAKIVILDEATANIDSATDNLIQTIIRKKLKDSTVLTIAHRLNTIMDSNRFVVIEEGAVVEIGTKDELLRNPDGYFYKYVHQKF